jgi:NADPH:quinone reductase-like Zn-dependent oxidoreductase
VLIGRQGGVKSEIDIMPILLKRLTITGSTLRTRSVAEKGALAEAVRAHVWPLLEAGRAQPIIHATFPLADAAEAHRVMEASTHIGKLVLVVERAKDIGAAGTLTRWALGPAPLERSSRRRPWGLPT